MTVEYRTVTDVDNRMMMDLWELYHTTFTPLATVAIQRHVMFWEEFTCLVGDAKVVKHLAHDEHGLAGLALITRDLSAVPLISPEFFEHNWPTLYGEGRIFYVPFVCVRQEPRPNAAIFSQLVTDMSQPVAELRGIAVMDYCAANVRLGLPRTSQRILARAHNRVVPVRRADEQSFWTYDFSSAP